MSVLKKALIMSYVNSKITIKNLEVALHEMSVIKDEDVGKLQFYTERLIKANKDMYGILEKNLTPSVVAAVMKDVENLLDKCWENGDNV
jgi:bisphosphoglycerate-dependent phosphoglycerate mutase